MDKFIVLTNEDKKQWKYVTNIIAIPNFTLLNSDHKVSYLNKNVITVGQLVPGKQIDQIIFAWKIVNKYFPEWKLNIIGEGILCDKLQNQIDECNLSNSILLKGAIKNMQDEYLNSSIFVMSSRAEGMPMVLLEAIAYKLPIVSYAFPCGARDLVDHNVTGILIDKVGDINGLANGLMDLMQSEDLRRKMGEACDINKFSVDNIMKTWMDMFSEVLSDR